MPFYDKAAEFIAKYEGFTSKATWDVNAWRIGHGSDTITLVDGTYRKVAQGDSTTKELADKDLARRIKNDFEPKVKKQIGEKEYNRLPDASKIALISLAYNYGGITHPKIIEAAQTGNAKKLADAIVEETQNDNKSLSQGVRNALLKRRQEEANFILEYAKRNPGKVALGVIILLGLGLTIYFVATNKNKIEHAL